MSGRQAFEPQCVSVGSRQSASVRQSFQPRDDRILRLVDGILRKMFSIHKPAQLIERGRRVCTDAVESVPALKPCQSTGLCTVGGIAQNENSAIGASGEWRQMPSMALAFSAALRSSCSFGFVVALRMVIGLLDQPRRENSKQGTHLGSREYC